MYETIKRLEDIIDMRIKDKPEGSYTVKLVTGGLNKIAKKIGEESSEVIIASLAENNQRLIEETADLLYHLLVLLHFKGLSLKDVEEELLRRMKK
jgi:phosphoribosyl-ATP pyrophosphohydrolase